MTYDAILETFDDDSSRQVGRQQLDIFHDGRIERAWVDGERRRPAVVIVWAIDVICGCERGLFGGAGGMTYDKTHQRSGYMRFYTPLTEMLAQWPQICRET